MSLTSQSRFRVRYAETDQMGVVYYANYFVWMEVGRTDFCKESGFNYHDLEKEEQTFVAVAEAQCRYVAPSRFDDEIVVETRIEKVGRRMMEFSYTIRNQNGVVAEGRTVHVTIGSDGRPKQLPPKYLEMMKG